MKSEPLPAVFDGLGNALGYSVILLGVGTIREIFGSGTWFGIELMPLVQNGGWYQSNGLFLLPPSAFFIIGFFIWIIRQFDKSQVEPKA